MENNIERLTIKEIAPFLPYGLTGTVTDEMRLEYISYVDMVGDELITFKNAPDVYFEEIENFKPHLYPISCLTKTIQHEEREFCPIVELAKLSSPYAETEITEVEFWEEDEEIVCNLIKGTRVIYYIRFKGGNFYTDEEYNRFLDQYQLFQKLAEWHINFVGIPEGLYIDKNTLKP